MILDLYKKTEKILLVGPYPNPLGGVAVHTKRLFTLLKAEGYHINLFKLNRRKLKGMQWLALLCYLVFNRFDVVHIQSFEPMVYKFILFLTKLKGSKVILTIHHPLVDDKMLKNKNLITSTDVIVVVGDHITHEYQKAGINIQSKVKVISPYLSPDFNEEENILSTYPNELINFINDKEKIMLVSAFQLVLKDGIDLYGVDRSIEMLKSLVEIKSSVGLIIAIGNPDYNQDYFKKIISIIDSYNLSAHIFFLLDQREIWPLFKRINLFLRPTYSDGFGISVAEALELSCPAIASNVCKRANGATLYEYSNNEEFLNKVKNVICNNETSY